MGERAAVSSGESSIFAGLCEVSVDTVFLWELPPESQASEFREFERNFNPDERKKRRTLASFVFLVSQIE